MIKKIIPGLVLGFALLFVSNQAFAKRTVNTGSKLKKSLTKKAYKYIDVNQIRCVIINDGSQANHPISGDADMEWPKGTGNMINFMAGPMLMGEVNGELRTACDDYYPEYQGGIILEDGSADDPDKPEYRVYKVNKSYPNGDTGLDIDSWDDWKTYAENQGAPAIIADSPGDTIKADNEIIPDKKWVGIGDEILYCVMNDLDQGLHSTNYQSVPIGVELHMLVFAYDRPGPLGNSIFIKYIFINKGESDLENAYIGQWADIDNGDANDDLVGYNAELGMGYCYGGKPSDATYGSRPPAIGYDFFQGPIVESIGDTVRLPDGRVFPDSKIIYTTAFTKYYNAGGDNGDPPHNATGAPQMYYLLQGFKKDGDPWVNPITGEETKFNNTGDPVAGTGWLSTAEYPPADIRLNISAGPFTLAVGDTQEIVVGSVIAQGGDRLSSVALLNVYDRQLQQAYDLGFRVPNSPNPPNVTLTELDREIMLTWGKSSESYDDAGYLFEGYNVYIGDTPGGPWKRLVTYDVTNNILGVKDEQYDPNSGAVVNLPSAFGSDGGTKYNYTFTKDYNGYTLANGRTYYVAVTSYGFNLGGTPKILESSKTENLNLFWGTPHKPRPGTIVNEKVGEEIEITHSQGIADSLKYEVWVKLFDPMYVETASYEVTINPDSSWTLWKNGQAIPNYTDVKEYGIDKNIEYSTLIGADLDFYFGINANFNLDPVRSFTPKLLTENSDSTMLTELTSPYDGGKPTSLAADGQFRKGTRDVSLIYNKLEVRFTGVWDSTTNEVASGGQMATLLFSFGDPAHFMPEHPKNPNPGSRDPFLIRVPFEIWDVVRNVQLNVSFTDNAQQISEIDSGTFVPTWAPRGNCVVYVVASEYDEQIHNISYTGQDTMATWTFTLKPDAIWNTGDIIQLAFPQPLPIAAIDTTVETIRGPVTLQPDRFTFIIKGVETNVVSSAKERLDLINVYPNPYLGHSILERKLHQEHVSFINLPEKCTIRIFTISGSLVQTLEFDDPTSTTLMWNLRNENGLPVASGLYIAYIDIPGVGEKILKMAIIFRQQRLKNM